MSIGCFSPFNGKGAKKMGNDKQTEVVGVGLSFSTVIFAVLLLLKAGIGKTAAISWSWWWITCPLWGPFALVLSFFLLAILIFLVGFLVIALTKFCIYLYKKFLNGK